MLSLAVPSILLRFKAFSSALPRSNLSLCIYSFFHSCHRHTTTMITRMAMSFQYPPSSNARGGASKYCRGFRSGHSKLQYGCIHCTLCVDDQRESLAEWQAASAQDELSNTCTLAMAPSTIAFCLRFMPHCVTFYRYIPKPQQQKFQLCHRCEYDVISFLGMAFGHVLSRLAQRPALLWFYDNFESRHYFRLSLGHVFGSSTRLAQPQHESIVESAVAIHHFRGVLPWRCRRLACVHVFPRRLLLIVSRCSSRSNMAFWRHPSVPPVQES